MNDENQATREHVLYVLRGGGAHMSLEDFVKGFKPELCNRKIPGLPYTAWQVLEHMRIAQWDILNFSLSAEHASPDFPNGYWPKTNELGSPPLWEQSINSFLADQKAMEQLVADPQTDVFANIPHGDGQTILREALLTADHNAYHLGALVVIKRLVENAK